MNIELTDLKRYELELDNCLSIILSGNRLRTDINEIDLARALNIDQASCDKLVLKLKAENIIK